MPFDFSCWELSRGGQDPAWRDYFFGRIDCRLTNQCLPLDFTGAVGVKIPAAWHIRQSAQPVGVAVGFVRCRGKTCVSRFRCGRRLERCLQISRARRPGRCGRHGSTISILSVSVAMCSPRRCTHGLKPPLITIIKVFFARVCRRKSSPLRWPRRWSRQRQGDHWAINRSSAIARAALTFC